MEHSVCKVSLAHHTKAWLSALFEAHDGLELSVNNYLFTLLWIACRNKRLSHHLYQRSPPSSPSAFTTYDGAQKGRTGNGDHMRSFSEHTLPLCSQPCGWGGPVSCRVSAAWIFSHLSCESTPCNRCCIWADLSEFTPDSSNHCCSFSLPN